MVTPMEIDICPACEEKTHELNFEIKSNEHIVEMREQEIQQKNSYQDKTESSFIFTQRSDFQFLIF